MIEQREMELIIFFFNDTATTEIYTLSLHDALPICPGRARGTLAQALAERTAGGPPERRGVVHRLDRYTSGLLLLARSEEHTSELQSRQYLVCRLMLVKK